MFEKKNLKIISLVGCFVFSSFFNTGAMKRGGSFDRLNFKKSAEIVKKTTGQLKQLDIEKNKEFNLKKSNSSKNLKCDYLTLEEQKEENKNVINLPKFNIDLKKIDLEQNKIVNKTIEKLKEAYESFRKAIEEFDRMYAYESFALQKISETYSDEATEKIATKLVVDDIKNNHHVYDESLRKLNKMFRMRDEAFIAYPYNKIEECESKVLDCLDVLNYEFKRLKKLVETVENKEFLADVFKEYLIKKEPTVDEINKKYDKYIELTKGNFISFIGEKHKKILNEGDPFSYFEDVIKNNNYGISRTINYFLFYFTRIFVHINSMDLEREECKIFREEYLNLMEEFKKQELNALKMFDITKILEKEVELRKKAFNYIYKIGKKAEFCAENQIMSLHDNKKSRVKYVKDAIRCPERPIGEEIRELSRQYGNHPYIYIKFKIEKK